MAGRRYSSSGAMVWVTGDSILGINNAGTTIRHTLYEVVVGTDVTPADNAMHLSIFRATTAGTADNALTPVAHDNHSPASLCNANDTYTAEPTASGIALLNIGMNQQATFRWSVPPEEGFTNAVTAGHGFKLTAVSISGGTPGMVATFCHEE